jgi:hypothetical protein
MSYQLTIPETGPESTGLDCGPKGDALPSGGPINPGCESGTARPASGRVGGFSSRSPRLWTNGTSSWGRYFPTCTRSEIHFWSYGMFFGILISSFGILSYDDWVFLGRSNITRRNK